MIGVFQPEENSHTCEPGPIRTWVLLLSSGLSHWSLCRDTDCLARKTNVDI